jgi:hypothetical protein
MPRGCGIALLPFAVLFIVIGAIGTVVAASNAPRGGLGLLVAFIVLDVIGVLCLIVGVAILRASPPPKPPVSQTGRQETHELDGTPVLSVFTPATQGKNARPSALELSVAVDSPYEFEMVVETWFDRRFKKLGLAVEVQTGDDTFDDECYVRSDTPAFAAAYLADPIKRIAILDLRSFKFLSVKLANGRLSAKWVGHDPERDGRPDLIPDVAARLLVLSRNLPAPQPEFDANTAGARRTTAVGLWRVLVAFALTIFAAGLFPPIFTGDLVLRTLIGCLTAPIAGFVAALLLRGTSRSHYTWTALMLGGLFLYPVGCAGTAALLNAQLDGAVDEVRTLVIVEKYTTRHKNTTKYHVRVVSWRNPAETISFRTDATTYQAVVPNRSRLEVVTRPGALAMDWEKSRRVLLEP